MNRTHPERRRQPWTEGSLASWMAGVTLGAVLGVTLLIVTPRLMAGPEDTAKAPTAAEQSTSTTDTAETPDTEMTDTETPETEMSGTETTGTEMSDTEMPSTEASAEGPAEAEGGEALPAAQSPAVSGETTGEPAQQDTDAVAESVAAGGTGDAAPTPNAAEGNAEAGTTIYASSCAGCHGAEGGGGIGPSLLADDGPQAWTVAQFTTVLREGVLPEGRELSAVMPRFSEAQLSDEQVADLLAHIKTLN